MSRFGKQQRTKADKRAAALMFVTMSDRSDADKIDALQRSYGMSLPEAQKLVDEVKRRAA